MSYNDMKCKCGATKNLSYEPTLHTLIFGPYPGSFTFGTNDRANYEYRCPKCEKKVLKSINKMLDNLKK
jgi:hypothetical protein